MSVPRAVGIDFGTTNSVLALSEGLSEPHIVPFGDTATFRSLLCFYTEPNERGHKRVVGVAGPDAIATYELHGGECRLIQSVKNFVADDSFRETTVYGQRFRIEDLVGVILKQLRAGAEKSCGDLGQTVVSGRPVQFAGSEPNEALALKRLTLAYNQAGFSDVRFVEEPLAAADFHLRGLQEDALCLIADLGGGTSDFSLVQLIQSPEGPRRRTIGHAGIGVAGDVFDFRIIQNAVSPKLGKDSFYKSFAKRLPVPGAAYNKFQRWSELSMLRGSQTLRDLKDIRKTAEDAEGVAQLIYIIENELGLQLYRAVGHTKASLSSAEHSDFRFRSGPVEIEGSISRTAFESWIAQDIAAIMAVVDRLFSDTKTELAAVDRVFMTGGTSFVPAVRRAFDQRFQSAEIMTGDEFVSVAGGLALNGRC
ncbi:MAG: Hsp70 family protein [Rhizomicrobium sp.]|nr:Hsp70 family protein [Rhizomicrobium sp.]